MTITTTKKRVCLGRNYEAGAGDDEAHPPHPSQTGPPHALLSSHPQVFLSKIFPVPFSSYKWSDLLLLWESLYFWLWNLRHSDFPLSQHSSIHVFEFPKAKITSVPFTSPATTVGTRTCPAWGTHIIPVFHVNTILRIKASATLMLRCSGCDKQWQPVRARNNRNASDHVSL